MVSNYSRKKNNYFRRYVLKLEHGKYYVGLSHNVEKRFKMHKDGEGAEFTKIHKPIRVIKNVNTYATTYANAGPKEDNETLKLMKIFGRENVRGGRFCAVSQKVVDNLLGEEICKRIDASLKSEPNNKSKKDKVIDVLMFQSNIIIKLDVIKASIMLTVGNRWKLYIC